MLPNQDGGGGQAGDERQHLTDPDAAPIEAVHPQSLNHSPTQAVPGAVAQGDLAVVAPPGIAVIQNQKSHQIPHRFIQEGGVVVFIRPGDGVVKSHAEERIRGRAEGLPVEEVSPAADALADEKAAQHQIQKGGQVGLFDFAEDDHADHRADHRTVDGDAAVPDIQHGDGVLPVAVPGESTVVDSGADNGQGRDPQHAIQQIILAQSRIVAASAGIQHRQQQPQGDDQPVIMNLQGPQGKASSRIQLQAQKGKGNGGIVCRIHALSSSVSRGLMMEMAQRSRRTTRDRNSRISCR